MRAPRVERERPLGPARRAGAAARSGADARSGSGPALASVYALGKYVQERLTLTLAPAYGMEGVALRLWNVYGPGQALSNPYTGVLAIFASRLHNGQPPMIFEDGQQRRDFVHVEDVAQAFLLALEHPKAGGRGLQRRQRRGPLGAARSRRCSAQAMGRPDLEPEIAGKARVGDIRHCIADIAQDPRASSASRRSAISRTGSPSSPNGSREQEAEDRVARGPQGARAARARGMTAATPWTARARRTPAGPGHRRRRLHRLQPRRPPRPRGPRRARLRRPRASRRRAQPRLAASSGIRSRISAVIGDIRDERGRRRRGAARRQAVFHLAAQVAVTTSLVDPREDFDINVRGTLNLLEALRRRNDAGAADLRLHQQGLRRSRRHRARRDERRLPAARSGDPRDGHRRGPPARLPHALWLLQGRGRPVRARLRPQLRRADLRDAHELHLRPAPDGHRGPGLGRAFPDPRARRRADHASTATAARCATSSTSPTRSRPMSPPGGASTPCRAAPSTSAAARRTRSACASSSRHIEDLHRPAGRDRLRRLARRRPALLRLRHAPRRARARPASRRSRGAPASPRSPAGSRTSAARGVATGRRAPRAAEALS